MDRGANDRDAATYHRAAAVVGTKQRRASLEQVPEARCGSLQATKAQRAAHQAMNGDAVRPAVVALFLFVFARLFDCFALTTGMP